MAGASGNVKAGKAFVEIMLDQTKLERGLRSAQTKLKNFGSSLTTFPTRPADAGKIVVSVPDGLVFGF